MRRAGKGTIFRCVPTWLATYASGLLTSYTDCKGKPCGPALRFQHGYRQLCRYSTSPLLLVKILDRDLLLAGIPKRDERGRTLDVHALRTTFGTLLSKGGVSPRTAQEAMRHSKIELTMKVYTDPKLLDGGEALNALPALPLEDKPAGSEGPRATGTEGRTDGNL
jgi:integrase